MSIGDLDENKTQVLTYIIDRGLVILVLAGIYIFADRHTGKFIDQQIEIVQAMGDQENKISGDGILALLEMAKADRDEMALREKATQVRSNQRISKSKERNQNEKTPAIASRGSKCYDAFMKLHSDYQGKLSPRQSKTLEFIRDAVKADSQECILWPFTTGGRRIQYGQVRLNGKKRTAHRVALIFATGEDIEENACHKCRNPLCINPNHLYWGTAAENAGDKIKDGTLPMGEDHWNARITNEQALAIRADSRTLAETAKEFGLPIDMVSRIQTGSSWVHLSEPPRPSQKHLTDSKVIAIYYDQRTQTKIAADYEITQTNVSHIKTGKTWKHIPRFKHP